MDDSQKHHHPSYHDRNRTADEHSSQPRGMVYFLSTVALDTATSLKHRRMTFDKVKELIEREEGGRAVCRIAPLPLLCGSTGLFFCLDHCALISLCAIDGSRYS